ncbi:MAG: L-aspartate oxidase [Planctomycetes bacterium]|nr:L-aspartate oxidase [Planctomycetota bacterium]
MQPDLPELKRRYLATFRFSRIPHRFSDVLILGGGVAGLSAALAAAASGATEVLLVSKDAPDESATRWAQGGVAAVLSPEQTEDSVEKHIQDSLEAAAGLADEEAVRITVTEGVERVRELIQLGAEFDRDGAGNLHFTREGGHSAPRILHRGDMTGKEVARTLLAAVRERSQIHALFDTFAVDLITEDGACRGALLSRPDGDLEAVWAKTTILATGGAGRLYRETTNPPVATGDGLGMALRAGAQLEDLEFIQFHPTTLYVAGAERFLITEAARGEGGVLRDSSGRAFMERFHPLKDLAPRDIVSRAILTVMREQGENKVWLDLSALSPHRIRARFPHVLEMCAGFGIDIVREPIPVRPSAHYTIGGVMTDIHARTSLEGLLAAGEVACTGLHGANRLGSNSLLEGLVFGHRAGRLAAERASSVPLPQLFSTFGKETETAGAAQTDSRLAGGVNLDDLSSSLKSILWYRVGGERNGRDLESALTQIRSWIPYCLGAQFSVPRSWTLQNMLQAAYLITLSALRREESRGVHYRSDFPHTDDERWKKHSTICRDDL